MKSKAGSQRGIAFQNQESSAFQLGAPRIVSARVRSRHCDGRIAGAKEAEALQDLRPCAGIVGQHAIPNRLPRQCGRKQQRRDKAIS
jgi:hypothetical protein